jgi:predicted ferric reductase
VKTRDPLEYGWWLASRSAGIVAYLLLSLAVVIGLALALRAGSPRARLGLRAVHERVALLALGSVAAHGLFLLADPWLKPGVGGVLVPFTTAYRPFWTGLGILAGYLTAGLSLTYYLRRRIGSRRWRYAHRFIPVAWAMAAIHVAGAGTDAASLWLDVPLAVTAGLGVALLAERWIGRRAPRPLAPAAPGPPASPRFERDDAPAPLWSRR